MASRPPASPIATFGLAAVVLLAIPASIVMAIKHFRGRK